MLLALILKKKIKKNHIVFLEIDMSTLINKVVADRDLEERHIKQNLYMAVDGYGLPLDTKTNKIYTDNTSFANANWEVLYAEPKNLYLVPLWQKYDVLVSCMLLTFIISTYTFTLLRQREKDNILNRSLEDEKAQLKAIMDNMTQGVIMIDQRGIIRTFNNRAEIVFGYSYEEAIGQNVHILMPPPYKHEHDEYIQSYVDTGKAQIIGLGREVEGRKKDGTIFPLHLTVAEFNIGGERLFAGLTMDISEQKEKEKWLEKAKKDADKANREKSDFLANMSHELRTPLNSILGLARILMGNESLVQDDRDMAGTIYKGAVNLLENVNGILDISKIESGKLALETVNFDIKDVISNVMETMGPVAQEKEIAFSCNYSSEDIPYLIGDPFRIKQVLVNFVSNAFKYMPNEEGKGIPKEVEIFVSTSNKDNGVTEVLCSVRDTGIGIPEDKTATIFDKFIQADLSTTRKYGGTGLGLSISRELIEMMKGEIGVDSKVGKGSEFWFRIPLQITDVIDEDTQNRIRGERRKRLRKSTGASVPVHMARVLVAEDHLFNQDFIKRLLKRMGFKSFDIVENGKEAVEAFGENDYDLILMDCHMPEKNGYEATLEIREHQKENGKTIPIIALTADAMKGTRKKCLDVGMNEYLSKPIDSTELQNVLSRWIVFTDQDNQEKEEEVSLNNQNIEQTDPPADLSLFQEYADNPEDQKYFISLFLEQSEEGIEIMRENISAGPNTVWVEAAHKFKGGAGMIGAQKLYDLCAKAQQMEDVSADIRERILKEIESEFSTLKQYLKKHV
ncbi:MAG: ATP-binding protein [Alphaproteobacteria bacterium]|nr:ATP-binding protein [Alphaproteobacteria bacterium]